MRETDQARGATPRWFDIRRVLPAVAAACLTAVLVPALASAGDEPGSPPAGQRVQTSGTASGVHIMIDRPGFLLVSPLAEVAIPYASSGVNASGAAGYGSWLWPGPFVPGLGAAVKLVGGPPLVPEYPFAADARWPGSADAQAQPGARIEQGPVAFSPVEARGHAGEDGGWGTAAIADLVIGPPGPGTPQGKRLAAVRHTTEAILRGLSRGAWSSRRAADDRADLVRVGLLTTRTESTAASAPASASSAILSDVSLLGGLIHVGQIRSTAVTSTDEGPAKTRAAVDVSRVTIGDLAASIDEQGLTVTDQRLGEGQLVELNKQLQQAFGEAGITIRLPGARTAAGTESSDASGGALLFMVDTSLQPPQRDVVIVSLGAATASSRVLAGASGALPGGLPQERGADDLSPPTGGDTITPPSNPNNGPPPQGDGGPGNVPAELGSVPSPSADMGALPSSTVAPPAGAGEVSRQGGQGGGDPPAPRQPLVMANTRLSGQGTRAIYVGVLLLSAVIGTLAVAMARAVAAGTRMKP